MSSNVMVTFLPRAAAIFTSISRVGLLLSDSNLVMFGWGIPVSFESSTCVSLLPFLMLLYCVTTLCCVFSGAEIYQPSPFRFCKENSSFLYSSFPCSSIYIKSWIIQSSCLLYCIKGISYMRFSRAFHILQYIIPYFKENIVMFLFFCKYMIK